MSTKTLTVEIESSVLEHFEARARVEGWSVGNLIQALMKSQIPASIDWADAELDALVNEAVASGDASDEEVAAFFAEDGLSWPMQK